MTKALIVVDMQNDFVRGTLAVPGAFDIVGPVNDKIKEFMFEQAPTYFSLDWHRQNHPSFKEHGGKWPSHCVNGTEGAALYKNVYLPPDAMLILKGHNYEAYSAFDGVIGQALPLVHALTANANTTTAQRGFPIKEVHIVGLALDFCVQETALDAAAFGFKTIVHRDATAPVFADNWRKVEELFDRKGILLV